MDIIEKLTDRVLDKKKISKKFLTNIAKAAAIDFVLSSVYNKMKPVVINRIRSKYSVCIDFSENDGYTWRRINEILYRYNKTKYNQNREYTSSRDEYLLRIDTKYIIKMENKTFINVYTSSDSKGCRFIEIRIYGPSKEDVYKDIIRKLRSRSVDKTVVSILNNRWENEEIKSMNVTFEDIVLEKDKMNVLVNGLESWKNSENWYKDNKLVHKIGILLYGDPGTGKSTTVKAISSYLGHAPIMALNNITRESIMNFLDEIDEYDEPTILLIEDIDMICGKRKKKDNKKDENQNVLFQILDGLYSTDNVIVVATTNYKDKLDPALIRPGRFDIQVKLTNFDEKRALKFVKRFGYGKRELDSFGLEYPVQPALLQSKIMEHRSKELYGNN